MLCFCFGRRIKARIRANWKSHVSRFQPSLSLRDISPRGREPLSHFVTAPLSGEPSSASPERGGGPRQRWRGKTESKSQPSLSLRDISPKGREPLSHFVTAPLSGEPNQPLLKGEGDRASGGGVELPIYARPRWRGKLPQSCRKAANPAPSKREPALSVAARHLSQRERTPQSLRDSSPFRGAKSASPERGGGPRQRWRGRTPNLCQTAVEG